MMMWINFAIQLVFLYAYWFTTPQLNAYYGVAMMASRNPDLLDTRPDWRRSLNDTRWFLWPGYAVGALSMVTLTAIKFGVWLPEGLSKDGALFRTVAFSAIAGMAWWLVAYVAFMVHWRWHLPLAPKRQASLTIRHFDADVPRWAWYAAGGLLALNLAAQIALHLLGHLERPRFWQGLGWQTLYFFLVIIVAVWTVRRRPNALDRQYGPKFRRLETRLIATFLALLPLLSLLRTWRDLAGVTDAGRGDFAFSLLIFSVVVLAIRLWSVLNLPHASGPATPHARS